jgi:hypothetical protein
MITYILYSFILIVLFKLIFDNAKLKSRIYKKNVQVIQQALDTKEIIERLTSELEIEQTKSKKEDDGFLKFVTDSREWAYNYIESSQKTINEVAQDLKNKGLVEESEILLSLLPKEELS